MKRLFALLALVGLVAVALGLDNGVALKPPMGWSTWCTDDILECVDDFCNELELKSIADAMVKNGMKDLGYNIVELDDCWAGPRDANGNLTADRTRFPSGSLKPLADYVHSLGLQLGAYTCAGNLTCKYNRPGSWGHYQQDAWTFAQWGVDMVKMDFCYHPAPYTPQQIYGMMRDALNATGSHIIFSICEWGKDNPWEWGMETGNMWRVTNDHLPFFWLPAGHAIGWSTMDIIQAFRNISQYQGKGGWNDADFLMTGAITVTDQQSKVEFSFWSLINSPLIVTTDIRNMHGKQALLNQEVIAVNQDDLLLAGDIFFDNGKGGQIWTKKLVGPKPGVYDYAIIFYNTNWSGTQALSISWTQLGFSATQPVYVRDLWTHKSLGAVADGFTSKVVAWDCQMIRVSSRQI